MVDVDGPYCIFCGSDEIILARITHGVNSTTTLDPLLKVGYLEGKIGSLGKKKEHSITHDTYYCKKCYNTQVHKLQEYKPMELTSGDVKVILPYTFYSFLNDLKYDPNDILNFINEMRNNLNKVRKKWHKEGFRNLLSFKR